MKKPRKRKNTTSRSRLLENAIAGLRHLDFHQFKGMPEFKKAGLELPDRYLVRNYCHPSLYGTPGKKEAYINNAGAEYILECKLQNSSGSVDEKPVYVFECFLVSPILNWIVWFDGNWWTKNERGKAAVAWLRDRAGRCCPSERAFHVCASEDEWVELVDRLFKYKAGPT